MSFPFLRRSEASDKMRLAERRTRKKRRRMNYAGKKNVWMPNGGFGGFVGLR